MRGHWHELGEVEVEPWKVRVRVRPTRGRAPDEIALHSHGSCEPLGPPTLWDPSNRSRLP